MMSDNIIIFGINSVTTRLRRDTDGVERLMLRKGKLTHRLREIESLAREHGIRVEKVDEVVFDNIEPGSAHQGVALEVTRPSVVTISLDEILAHKSHPLLFLVLDGITDPRNLGACVRSAATMGADAVIVPKDKSASMTPVAVKTASGGAAVVPVIAVVNLSRCLENLKRHNVWIVGTLLDAEQSLADVDLTGHIAIVLGSEDKGLRQNTIQHCDHLAGIPMVNGELGFNVSVAAGISLYEVHRQRQAPPA